MFRYIILKNITIERFPIIMRTKRLAQQFEYRRLNNNKRIKQNLKMFTFIFNNK